MDHNHNLGFYCLRFANRHAVSDIEGLAFTSRYSRESDEVRWRGCIEHDFAKGLEIWTIGGTEAREKKLGS